MAYGTEAFVHYLKFQKIKLVIKFITSFSLPHLKKLVNKKRGGISAAHPKISAIHSGLKD